MLLHICCATCAIYPVEVCREEGHEVQGLWYNPNIHPYKEYRRRLESLRDYGSRVSLPVIYQDEYGLREFVRTVVNRETERCCLCYRLRLERTAQVAKERKFDSFVTTLLVSPYQKHDLIKQIGTQVGERLDIKFSYRDFRPGFKKGLELSRKMGLYHQQYCGCIYSEYERFRETK